VTNAGAPSPLTGETVLAVYAIRSQILALLRPGCQKNLSDGVNGQHR
jgi:hypothetical protein